MLDLLGLLRHFFQNLGLTLNDIYRIMETKAPGEWEYPDIEQLQHTDPDVNPFDVASLRLYVYDNEDGNGWRTYLKLPNADLPDTANFPEKAWKGYSVYVRTASYMNVSMKLEEKEKQSRMCKANHLDW